MQKYSKLLSIAVFSVATLALMGCSEKVKSNDLKEQPKEDVQDETEEVSSRILKLIDLKGKTTQVGALADECPGYPESTNAFRARHDWSVYNVPKSDLEEAMDRLRKGLPDQGWDIGKDGPNNSRNRNPEILAKHLKTGYLLEVTLMLRSEQDSAPSLIAVSVMSPCYKAPSEDE